MPEIGSPVKLVTCTLEEYKRNEKLDESSQNNCDDESLLNVEKNLPQGDNK